MNTTIMQRVLPAILTVFLYWNLDAQIRITDQSIPIDGDTLYFKTDRSPDIADLPQENENFTLDLSHLKAVYPEQQSFKLFNSNIFSGLPFKADLIMFEASNEKYFLNNTSKGLEIIASVEPHPFIQNDEILCVYNERSALTYTQLKYRDRGTESFSYTMKFDKSELPLSIYQNFRQIPDSLQIIVRFEVEYAVEGYGRIKLPSMSGEVLRMRKTIQKNIQYQVKGQSGWEQIKPNSSLIGGSLKERTSSLEYHYLGKDSGLPLAVITMSADNRIREVKFQMDFDLERNFMPGRSSKGISALPNPTFGDTRFEFFDHPQGIYIIEIYNIIGKKIWRREYQVDAAKIIKENFAFLKKGTYLYSIIGPNGNKLTTKRLVIITP